MLFNRPKFKAGKKALEKNVIIIANSFFTICRCDKKLVGKYEIIVALGSKWQACITNIRKHLLEHQ